MRASVILDETRLREAVAWFSSQKAFAFDVEAQGEHRGVCHLADVTWLSMATHGACIVIPFGHPIGSKVIGTRKEPRQYENGAKKGQTYNRNIPVFEDAPVQLPRELVFDILRPLFFREDIVKSGHGIIYDLAATAKYFGEVIPPPYNDTIIQSWLLDENRHRHGLKYLVKDFYAFDYDKESVGKCVESHPFGLVAHYSFCDAKYAWLLYKWFTPQIADAGLSKVYKLEMDILNVLVGMRLAGSRVDLDRLKQLKKELTARRATVRSELMDLAGWEFNPNSTGDKQLVLYAARPQGQGLKPWKPTETGKKQKKAGQPVTAWSTDDEVLESYSGNPVVAALRDYGDVSKLLSTYVLAYLGDESRDRASQIFSGRIHADFVQYGTTTRRFSCRDPNLQNIPRPDTELGKLIRGVWFADPGWKLVVGDYSQIELVVFAHFILKAGYNSALADAFINGEDPHQMTADKLGIERQKGKTINFSMSYGATKYKIASLLGVDVLTAESILEDHQRAFPELYKLKADIIAACKSREPVPYVRTLAGGYRRLPDINSRFAKVRGHAERQAVSAVIQGSAADLIKMAMVRADAMLADSAPDAFLTLSVHDEIVIESPAEQAKAAADTLHEAMCGVTMQRLISVPLKVDVKIVDRWSEAK